MAGDYSKPLRHYGDASFDYDLAAATAGPVTLMTPRNANYQIYVQKIQISVITFAAKTITFEDNGAPVVIAVASIPAAETATPGDEIYDFDFGPDGTPLTVGKILAIILSGAGVAARIHVQCYQKLGVSGISINAGASLQ